MTCENFNLGPKYFFQKNDLPNVINKIIAGVYTIVSSLEDTRF